jgi:hypothetical protein
VRLGSITSSHIVTLKNEDQPPPSCETQSAKSAQELGPWSWRPVTEEQAWGKGASAHHMMKQVPKQRHHRNHPSRETCGAQLGHVGISATGTSNGKGFCSSIAFQNPEP